MIVEVATPAMVNRVLDAGLVENFDIKICEYFERKCRVTQCFNCFEYGHTGRVCRNKVRCAECAGPHTAARCDVKTDGKRRRCTVCKQDGHAAWMNICPAREREVKRANQAYQNRPQRYAVCETPSGRRQNTSNPLKTVATQPPEEGQTPQGDVNSSRSSANNSSDAPSSRQNCTASTPVTSTEGTPRPQPTTLSQEWKMVLAKRKRGVSPNALPVKCGVGRPGKKIVNLDRPASLPQNE